MSEREWKGPRTSRDATEPGHDLNSTGSAQDVDHLRHQAMLRRLRARRQSGRAEVDSAAGDKGMVVDDREAQVRRVTKALITKNDNTRKAVEHGLQGAKDSILTDLIDEQLPGSAIGTFGHSFVGWLKDRTGDVIKEIVEIPLGAVLKIADPVYEAIDGYEEKKEILFSAEAAKKLIADLTLTTDAQLDGIRDAIFALGDESLQRLDGTIDSKPLVESGVVAAQVRLLFEQIVLPSLPVREQVARIHHLAENAINAGEQTERSYRDEKKR